MPETRNSSGIPHSDPHTMKTLKPMLGRGSFTNHDVPTANTAAEWNTTSPATTRARPTSSSGRRLPGRPGSDPEAAVPVLAAAITGLAMLVLLPGLAAVHGGRAGGECPQPAVVTSGAHPRADQQPHAGPHLGLPDDTAPQPSGLGSARRSRGDRPGCDSRLGAAWSSRPILAVLPGRVPAGVGWQNMLTRPAGQQSLPGGPRWLGGGRRGWAGPRTSAHPGRQPSSSRGRAHGRYLAPPPSAGSAARNRQ